MRLCDLKTFILLHISSYYIKVVSLIMCPIAHQRDPMAMKNLLQISRDMKIQHYYRMTEHVMTSGKALLQK